MTVEAGATRTDAQLQEDVLDELSWDPHVRPNEVGVSVKGGIVTLSGQVDTYLKKGAAGGAALRVRGIKAVANDLVVKLPSAAERMDTELARAALDALTWDAEIPTEQVRVTVANGWVTLKGEVDIHFQREAAERAVRHLAGVRGVINGLTIRPPTPAPADVQQRIERALIRSAETDAHRITVEVHGHTVTPRGTVRSYAERRAAEGSAWSAPGISAIENHIQIEL